MGKNSKKALVTNLGILTIVFVVILGFHKFCFGSDSGDPKDEMNQKLLQRIEGLERKVEDLTEKLKRSEEKPTAAVSAETEQVIESKVHELFSKKEKDVGLQTGLVRMPKISGHIDTIYNYNFKKPASLTTKIGTPGGAAGNNLSSYVTEANSIDFNTAHLVFSGSLQENTGYVIELDAGTDANVNTPLSGAGSSDDFDIQEAYLTYSHPGTGISVKAGKFVTLEGIEVIESPANPTISRGYLFGMAEPFTHVGALFSRALPIKGLELRAGVVNGWDLLKDNNEGKTVFGGLGINYGNWATGGLSIYFGPEQAANDSNYRTSIDLTLFSKPMEKLNIAWQANWGQEEGVSGSRFDHWMGFGIQPVYQFTDKLSLGGRAEYMDNKLGSRFGNRGGNLFNITVTPGYKLTENALFRVEYRHDLANNAFFESDSGAFDEKQLDQTLAEFVYTF